MAIKKTIVLPAQLTSGTDFVASAKQQSIGQNLKGTLHNTVIAGYLTSEILLQLGAKTIDMLMEPIEAIK